MTEKTVWTWRCLVCEKEVPKGDPLETSSLDESGCYPDLHGGTMELDFGYSSRYDLGALAVRYRIQSAICDDCYEKKQHVIRTVRVEDRPVWEMVGTGHPKSAKSRPSSH